jgi:hypothetical protein
LLVKALTLASPFSSLTVNGDDNCCYFWTENQPLNERFWDPSPAFKHLHGRIQGAWRLLERDFSAATVLPSIRFPAHRIGKQGLATN